MNLDKENIVSVVSVNHELPNYLEIMVRTDGPYGYKVFGKTGAVLARGEMNFQCDDGESGVTTRMDLAVIFAKAHIDMVRFTEGAEIPLPDMDEQFEWTVKYRIGQWGDGDCPFLYPNVNQLTTWEWGDMVVKTPEAAKAIDEANRRYEKAMKEI